MRHFFLLFALLISGLAQAGNNPFETKPEFLPVDKAFVLTSERLESGETQLFWQIANGYYLYRHRIAVRVLSGFKANPTVQLPAGHKKTDPYFGEVETYRERLTGVLPGKAADGTDIKVSFQRTVCQDDMSGQAFGATAMLTVGARQYHGCGDFAGAPALAAKP